MWVRVGGDGGVVNLAHVKRMYPRQTTTADPFTVRMEAAEGVTYTLSETFTTQAEAMDRIEALVLGGAVS